SGEYFLFFVLFFFFQAEDGIRDFHVTGVQTCALPILATLSTSSQWKSSHAVRTASTSASSTAAYGSSTTSMPSMGPGPDGSYPRTIAPRAASRWRMAMDGDSRRSSVRALKVRPHAPMRLPSTLPP